MRTLTELTFQLAIFTGQLSDIIGRDVIPGSPEWRGPESMNTGLWNMDSSPPFRGAPE
jgi:hypothetical protein